MFLAVCRGFIRQSNQMGMMENGHMFYPVKIFNSKGEVKKILTPKSLSKQYWGDFFNQDIKSQSYKMKVKGRKIQKKTEAQEDQNINYEDVYFSEH